MDEWLRKLADDWGVTLALSAMAGLIAAVNHTPPEALTARRIVWMIATSMLVSVIAVLIFDGFDWSEKRKIGASVVLGYMAFPILDGGWRLAMLWCQDPVKFITSFIRRK